MKTTTKAMVGALSACLLSACFLWDSEEEVNPIDWEECSGVAGDHPCNIVSFDQSGDPFSLYDFYGQPIVVDLSAMWCGPCANAAAEAQAVQDIYADDELIYITVLIENTRKEEPTLDDIQDWAEAYGNVTTPVVAGSRAMLESSGQGTWVVGGWPTFYYIDSEMITRDIDRGFSSEEVAYSIEAILEMDENRENQEQ